MLSTVSHELDVKALSLPLNMVFLSGDLPNSIDSEWGQGRRFCNTFRVSDPDCFDYFFGWGNVPIRAYSLEVGIERHRQKIFNKLMSLRDIRTAIELTCRLKFRNGTRGFYQSFLKHFSPTFLLDTSGCQHFRKQRRRKVEKPIINLNPTMKCAVGKGVFSIFLVCKYKDLFKVIEAECSHTNNRYRWQFIVHSQYGSSNGSKIKAGF